MTIVVLGTDAARQPKGLDWDNYKVFILEFKILNINLMTWNIRQETKSCNGCG